MKKLISLALILFLLVSPCYGAWDATKPTNAGLLKDAPAQLRANFDALALGTDSALQITNAKVAAGAAIVDTKLAQITTAGKVSGTALTLLPNTPPGAGALPIANGGTGQITATAALTALMPSQTGNSGKALVTNGTVQSLGYPADLTIASQAQGDLLFFNGTNWTRLGAGTAGYVLKSQGAGANPAYLQTLPTANGGTGSTANANAAGGVVVPTGAVNAANGAVVLDGSSKLPAVDGSLLTGISGFQDGGVAPVSEAATSVSDTGWHDVSGCSVSITLTKTGTICASYAGDVREVSLSSSTSLSVRIVYDSTALGTAGYISAPTKDVNYTLGTGGKVTSIAAGTYTVKVQVSNQSSGTYNITTSGVLTVYAW